MENKERMRLVYTQLERRFDVQVVDISWVANRQSVKPMSLGSRACRPLLLERKGAKRASLIIEMGQRF